MQKNCSNTEQKKKHVQPIAMHRYEAQLALITCNKCGNIPLKVQEIKTGSCKLFKLSKELQGTSTFYCYTRMHGSIILSIYIHLYLV
jgi:hypothetical protein